jgi:phosphate transport system substrate-binding protein
MVLIFTVSASSFAATYVKVDGSSTVYPITEAVAEEFQKTNKDVRVTVGISGTGGGFKKFCRGETDISDASRPIKPSEVELCAQNGIEYIELPVAYDGLAVMVNPQNTWVDNMTPAELKMIWEPEAQETITRWNQIRPEWPNAEIALFGAGTDSGTYDYFTEAIVGKEGASRGDFTSSEDDNVLVYGIAGDKNSLGFFGLAYYEENKDKLKLVPIDNGGGPVLPMEETVNNGTYQPLSRPIFIYVSTQSAQKPEVKSFVEFYIKNTAKLSREVGYVHLPAKVLSLAADRFMKGKTGSVFGGKGSQVGVSIADLMASE